MDNNHELISEQFRQVAGLPEGATHVDEVENPTVDTYGEPEGGFGGEDGDPDTTGVGGGRPAFQAERISDDLDDSDQEDVVMAAGPVEDAEPVEVDEQGGEEE